MTNDTDKSAAHWDSMQEWHAVQPTRVRWWESDFIQSEINRRICGKPLDGVGAGIMELMRRNIRDLPVKRALSIGSGPGIHEAIFVQNGLIEHFDLFDISPGQVAGGVAHADSLGISDKMTFTVGDAFAGASEGDYDLVFWCGSLHHMPDVEAAIGHSVEKLRPGGWFLMNEYVAADRFQWSNAVVAAVNLGRSLLPDIVFKTPRNPRHPHKRFINRPSIEEMDYDPSEAMDSARIVPTFKEHFPKGIVRNVGGNFYHLGLSDILTNMSETSGTLRWCMRYDRLLSFMPHYVVAIGQKS